MADRPPDEAFAQQLLKVGLVTAAQVKAAFQAQAERALRGEAVTLGQILVEQGLLTSVQRESLEKKLESQRQEAKRLGPYRILKKLGEGGMGAVYLVEDPSNKQKVALKVLPKVAAKEEDAVRRFLREVDSARKLDHPNIVRAGASGEDRGFHYYVMEYVEGETLGSRLKREVALPSDEAAKIILQIARGLKYAHEQGYIHRDIKPDNVVLSKEGVAKILDMGLSKNIDEAQSFRTVTGVALGTPHYIAPEQARADKGIDGRADIYSLGATYYHLVTGETPFHGTTAIEIISQHLNKQLPDPRDLRDGIPDGIVHVLRRMMAKKPGDRYRDCGDLITDLDLVLGGRDPASQALDAAQCTLALPMAVEARTRFRQERQGLRKGTVRATTRPKSSPMPLILGGGVAAVVLIVVVAVAMSGGAPKPGGGAKETRGEALRPRAPEPRPADPAPPFRTRDELRSEEARRKLDEIKAVEPRSDPDEVRRRYAEFAKEYADTAQGRTIAGWLASSEAEKSKPAEPKPAEPVVAVVKPEPAKARPEPSPAEPAVRPPPAPVMSMGPDLLRGLLGYWKLDEGVGTKAAESSGKGGPLILGSGVSWGAGRFGRALQFEGADGWTKGPQLYSSVTDTFTLSFWAKPAATRESTVESTAGIGGIRGQRFVIYPVKGGGAAAGVSLGTNGIGVYEHDNGHLPCLLDHVAILEGWVHVTVVFENRVPSLYVNGRKTKTGLKGSRPLHPSACFSSEVSGGGYGPYKGLVDEVRIYDRGLSDEEIGLISGGRSAERIESGKVPDPVAQREAEAAVRKAFAIDQAKTAKDKADLARTLVQTAATSGARDAELYVLLRVARDLAAQGLDVKTALEAIDARAAVFDLDVLAEKGDLITKTTAKGADAAAWAGAALDVAEEASEADDYETAVKLGVRAEALARAANDKSLLETAKARSTELADLKRVADGLKGHFKTLETKPDDPAANAAVGKFVCLVKGDWNRGLPMLAKGPEPALKNLAEQELTNPTDAAAQAVLGEAWAALAERETATYKVRARGRAAEWLEVSILGLTGLAKVSAERRLKSLGPMAATRNRLMLDLGGGVKMELIHVKPGTFTMGGTEAPGPPWEVDMRPEHPVTLTKGYYLGKTEVTQAHWEAVMGGNPSGRRGADLPVEQVSFEDCQGFLRKLNEKAKHQLKGRVAALPTEAQWEYACRAGTKTKWSFGDDEKALGEHGWFNFNGQHPVGQKKPNAWGFHDMHGNVMEWCQDWAGPYAGAVADPTGPAGGDRRILRGGGGNDAATICRTAFRGTNPPSTRHSDKGFRLAVVGDANARAIPAPARTTSLPSLTLDLADGVTLETVYIKPGVFTMGGTPAPGPVWQVDERPEHQVTITKGYSLGRTEVTRGQFAAFVKATNYKTDAEKKGKSQGLRADGVWGEIPGANWKDPVVCKQTDEHPAICISWHDAKAFCDWASKKTGREVRLPTEAEWEYACRAGTKTSWSFGDNEASLGEYGWFNGNSNSNGQSHPVGQKRANPWGLHDMHGNILEWCQDWEGPYAGDAVDPMGPAVGYNRCLRGGSMMNIPIECRSAFRHRKPPADPYLNNGFRVALPTMPEK